MYCKFCGGRMVRNMDPMITKPHLVWMCRICWRLETGEAHAVLMEAANQTRRKDAVT